jgi:predicted nucleic acid-binding protein
MRDVFIDTNVLVYADQGKSPFHSSARRALLAHDRRGDELWINRQVVREYLAVVTRPSRTPPHQPLMSAEGARSSVESLLQVFRIADDAAATTAQLLEILTQIPVAGRQVHDANIVATMLSNGIPTLLTFNLDDFRRFSAMIEIRVPDP